MKEEISNKIGRTWQGKKERQEILTFDNRKKIRDAYTIQTRDGYPSPIERGLFRSYYLCPVCDTELDIELYDAGILTVCSECEYKYFDVRMHGLKGLRMIMEEFNGKGKNTEPAE